jgi:O-acetyl-ADP-ribose deacetylase (regulator of RNase III)
MESAVLTDPEPKIIEGTLRVVRGDITEMDLDAFVFYAQPDLKLGSGFGGAIAVRGGATIQKELDEAAAGGPLEVGEVVVTGGGKLKAKQILHAVGPRFKEPDTEGKLRLTMRNCLKTADERGVIRLAFPLMGSGYYGILPSMSAKVMVETIREHLAAGSRLEDIVVCVFDTPQFTAVDAAVKARS